MSWDYFITHLKAQRKGDGRESRTGEPQLFVSWVLGYISHESDWDSSFSKAVKKCEPKKMLQSQKRQPQSTSINSYSKLFGKQIKM